MVYVTPVGRTWRWLPPQPCLLCDAPARGRALCPGCYRDLPWQTAACVRCALPLPAAESLCAACRQSPPLQQHAVAPLRYEFPLDHLVAGLKYRRQLAPARLLGRLLGDAVLAQDLPRPDLLLPVPLHRDRLAERGYNQALEIARPLARATGLPLETCLVQRQRATAAQMTLDAAARATNPRGAFRLDTERLARLGRIDRVAVVDDVMTTGATLAEIAGVLLAGGIAAVDFWVVARTP